MRFIPNECLFKMFPRFTERYSFYIGGLMGLAVVGCYAYERIFYRLPPGPWTLLFFGKTTKNNETEHEKNQRLSEEYGSIVSYWCGTKLRILLNDYEVIKEAFVTRGDEFSQNPPEPISKFMKFHDRFVTVDYDENLKIMKKSLLGVFRSLFGPGKSYLEDTVHFELFHKFMTLKDNEIVEARRFFKTFCANVACTMYFGKRFEYESKEMQELFDVSGYYFKWTFFELTLKLSLIPLPFFVKKLIYRNTIKKAKNSVEEMRRWVRKMIKESKNNEGNLVAGYQKIVPDASVEEIVDTLLFLLGDPLDTVPGAIAGMLYLVATKPEIQEKLMEEISKIDLTKSRQTRLVYVEAFITETLRFSNFSTTSAPHQAAKDTTLRGYRIPKHAHIFANLYTVHMNKKVMNDCFKFRPERHLTNKYNVIPFGIGRRSCLGEQWTKSQMYLVLVTTLQKYRLELAPSFNETQYSSDIFLLPDKVELLFIDRNRAD